MCMHLVHIRTYTIYIAGAWRLAGRARPTRPHLHFKVIVVFLYHLQTRTLEDTNMHTQNKIPFFSLVFFQKPPFVFRTLRLMIVDRSLTSAVLVRFAADVGI